MDLLLLIPYYNWGDERDDHIEAKPHLQLGISAPYRNPVPLLQHTTKRPSNVQGGPHHQL